jgi:hypothetical protein
VSFDHADDVERIGKVLMKARQLVGVQLRGVIDRRLTEGFGRPGGVVEVGPIARGLGPV